MSKTPVFGLAAITLLILIFLPPVFQLIGYSVFLAIALTHGYRILSRLPVIDPNQSFRDALLVPISPTARPADPTNPLLD